MSNQFLFLITFFLIFTNTLFAQTNPKKPNYVIVANDKIITKNQLDSLGAAGRIKSMNKGVDEKERNRLFNKLGNQIGDKEFIITLGIFTDKELIAKEIAKGNPAPSLINTADKNPFKITENQVAADFTVQMLKGKPITLSDLKGKVVMINFWATWCAPCIMEFYDFPKLIIEPNKNNPFELLPISIGEPKETVIARMNKLKDDGIVFNVGYDTEQHIWDLYATGAIPKSILIDKKGIVRLVTEGNSDENLKAIVNTINQLVAE